MTTDVDQRDLPAVVDMDNPMSVNQVLTQSLIVHEILERAMMEDIHYGTIPGTKKKTLYLPGAEKICMTFRLAPKFDVEDLSDPGGNFYRYRAKCSLYTIRDGLFIGSAMGEASTAEEKYQWEAALNQKHWDSTDPDKRRIKFRKNKEADGGVEEVLQVQQNCADLANTVLKMACKRAFTSATKGATAASDVLDVDMEEEAVAKMRKEELREGEAPKMKAKPKPSPKLAFGRSKGKSIDDPSVPIEDLEWMSKYLSDGLQNPGRAQYHAKDRETIANLMGEIDRRQNAAPESNTAVPDDVWKDMCATWAKSQPKEYRALKTELGIEHAGELPPEERAGFRDRMIKK